MASPFFQSNLFFGATTCHRKDKVLFRRLSGSPSRCFISGGGPYQSPDGKYGMYYNLPLILEKSALPSESLRDDSIPFSFREESCTRVTPAHDAVHPEALSIVRPHPNTQPPPNTPPRHKTLTPHPHPNPHHPPQQQPPPTQCSPFSIPFTLRVGLYFELMLFAPHMFSPPPFPYPENIWPFLFYRFIQLPARAAPAPFRTSTSTFTLVDTFVVGCFH